MNPLYFAELTTAMDKVHRAGMPGVFAEVRTANRYGVAPPASPISARADGKRQMSVAVNLMRWNKLDVSGKPQQHPIDDALRTLYQLAMCGSEGAP